MLRVISSASHADTDVCTHMREESYEVVLYATWKQQNTASSVCGSTTRNTIDLKLVSFYFYFFCTQPTCTQIDTTNTRTPSTLNRLYLKSHKKSSSPHHPNMAAFSRPQPVGTIFRDRIARIIFLFKTANSHFAHSAFHTYFHFLFFFLGLYYFCCYLHLWFATIPTNHTILPPITQHHI